MPAGSSSFKRLVFALALAAGAVVLVGVWLLPSKRQPAPHDEAPPAGGPPSAAAPGPAPSPARAPGPKPSQPAPARPEEPVAQDGIGFMPLHEEDRASGEMLHPHRVTEQTRRNFAEIRLVGALDNATDARDVPAMKRFLEQYRRDYPEDQGELQDGYAAIIDCFEHPGPESRAAAERWIDRHNGSTVKRSVLRHCVDPQQP